MMWPLIMGRWQKPSSSFFFLPWQLLRRRSSYGVVWRKKKESLFKIPIYGGSSLSTTLWPRRSFRRIKLCLAASAQLKSWISLKLDWFFMKLDWFCVVQWYAQWRNGIGFLSCTCWFRSDLDLSAGLKKIERLEGNNANLDLYPPCPVDWEGIRKRC